MSDPSPLIGLRLPRLEAAGKITGRSEYTDDLSRPRMLAGAILGSPYPHARIVSYDVPSAAGLPGVEAVITAQDFPYLPVGPVVKDETILAREKVRYVGEAVAAVAAIDRETALAALKLIEIEHAELAAVLSPQDALAPGAPASFTEPFAESGHEFCVCFG